MNGDGSGRAGLKQLIDERKQAELGATGLGRLGLTSTGTSVQISEEAAQPAFGFKIDGATATGSAITASVGAGPPPDANFNLTSIPADGDKITLTLQDQDGNSYNVELTARSGASAGGLTDSFQIGATVADTVANLNAALTAAVQEKATAELAPRAAMQAASDFFAGSPSNPPQRVDGPPFTSATGMVAGTAANTMIWYKGDDTAASPRATMPVRIDDGQTVSTGAQANEPAIQNVLAQLGVLAAETFTDTPQDKARYNTLTDQIAGNLASGGSGPKVEDIAAELASSNTAMQAAKDRHTDTQKMLQDTLDSNELANPDEVGVSILALQTRLQASYQTTSMLSQLSLVNFL
jgi:flagellar hook-associated protein 3 FlgL